ncbi:TPA: helix-turn-helix domain-containing protein [Legionella pneumophila]
MLSRLLPRVRFFEPQSDEVLRIILLLIKVINGINSGHLAILKNGKAIAIRFNTLEAICAYLQCQPGDIIEYRIEQFRDK